MLSKILIYSGFLFSVTQFIFAYEDCNYITVTVLNADKDYISAENSAFFSMDQDTSRTNRSKGTSGTGGTSGPGASGNQSKEGSGTTQTNTSSETQSGNAASEGTGSTQGSSSSENPSSEETGTTQTNASSETQSETPATGESETNYGNGSPDTQSESPPTGESETNYGNGSPDTQSESPPTGGSETNYGNGSPDTQSETPATGGSETSQGSDSNGTPGTDDSNVSTENQPETNGTEVHDFKLLVEPYRQIIYNNEQTTITIDLHEIDSAGQKIQGFRQEVLVDITGVVDGIVTPGSGKIILDDIGVAWIEYKAGENDKQIKIAATFSPPGYPKDVKDEATITVKPLEYDATLTVTGSYKEIERNSYNTENSGGVEDGTYDMQENRKASFYVPLKFENAYDVAIQNQRWEFYRPLDINLSSFNASFRSRRYSHASGHGSGRRSTETKNKFPVNKKVSAKEYLLQSNIILIIDKKTNKVVKIGMGGFGVEFSWNETENSHSESWWKPPPGPGHETKDKTDTKSEDDTFNAQPVEDLIPDPTYVSVSESLKKYMKDLGTPLPANVQIPEEKEEIPEIEPDLLVKSGDGKTYFGGEGKKIIDNSEGSTIHRKELSFSWQVTRKKKTL